MWRNRCRIAAAAAVWAATAAASSAWFLYVRLQAVSAAITFDTPDGATAGFGNHHQQHRRPLCEPSDDPEYACLVSRPPGAFDGEIMVYLLADETQLSVKVVVPGAGGGGRGWASLGFSPNGRMAGPSEAVVGFVGVDEGIQEPALLRYRMDGYSASSVTPLPEHDQILAEQAVETNAKGSLVVRFKRPLSAAIPQLQQDCRAAPVAEEDTDHAEEALATMAACIAAAAAGGERKWLDPREEDVVLLWAYASRGSWPSYHDAVGAFLMPDLTPIVRG